MFTLRVDELQLCLCKLEDADELFAVTDKNRDYLRPWLDWVDGTQSANDTAEHILRCQENFAAGTSIALGIRRDNKWVGSVGLHDTNSQHRKAELGYWLDADAQGHGIMTRSAQTLIDYGFGERNLNRIWLRCATNNYKSIAVAKRLKFTYEGTLRQNELMYDQFEDDMMWSLLKSEWESHKI